MLSVVTKNIPLGAKNLREAALFLHLIKVFGLITALAIADGLLRVRPSLIFRNSVLSGDKIICWQEQVIYPKPP